MYWSSPCRSHLSRRQSHHDHQSRHQSESHFRHFHHDHDHHVHDHGHEPEVAAPANAAARAAATGCTVVRVEQMDCPTEERMIRARLGSADGVVALDFNLLERHLTIHHTVDDVAPFLEALRAIGMDGEVLEQRERLAAASAEPTQRW